MVGCASLFTLASCHETAKKDDGKREGYDSFSGGLHEYRKVGASLVGLWREYIAMSDALSHALRDYNVAIRQEQRAELARLLAQKYYQAEASIAGHKAKQGRVPPTVLYSELASLKELKRQMKRLDRKIGLIPDYTHPEENVMLLRSTSAPVNVSKALSHSSGTLFHKALASYYSHASDFAEKFHSLRSFLYSIKEFPGDLERPQLIKQAVEAGNFFDTEAPISLHSQTHL